MERKVITFNQYLDGEFYEKSKHAERVGFVETKESVSSVSEVDKFTQSVAICSVAILNGIDKETGKRISFLTHQMPVNTVNRAFSNQTNSKYLYPEPWKLIKKGIEEFIRRVDESTIEFQITGGSLDENYLRNKKETYNSIRAQIILSRQIQSIIRKYTRPNFDIASKTRVLTLPNFQANRVMDVLHLTQENKTIVIKDNHEPYEFLDPVPLSAYLSELKKTLLKTQKEI